MKHSVYIMYKFSIFLKLNLNPIVVKCHFAYFKIYFTLQLFINNEWVDSVSGKKFSTINPANEKVIAEISEAEKVNIFCYLDQF